MVGHVYMIKGDVYIVCVHYSIYKGGGHSYDVIWA